MSSLRYEPPHQPAPVGRGHPSRAVPDDDTGRPRPGPDAAPEFKMETEPFLSVVVPAKNEAASLPQLIDEIARALRPVCRGPARRLDGFGIIVVDDGSTDHTMPVLKRLVADYPELRVLKLAVSGGQSAATVVGIRAAGGGWIATLDADLQNDPADLVRLWDALPGHDAALGWRQKRQDDWSRWVVSQLANWVRNAVLGQSIRDTGCSVRIFSWAAAVRLPVFRGVHRFFGPLLLREGCRLVQVPVSHRLRRYGQSHYNLWNRSLQVVMDLFGVAWLMRRPLHYQVVQTWGGCSANGESNPASVCLAAGSGPWHDGRG